MSIPGFSFKSQPRQGSGSPTANILRNPASRPSKDVVDLTLLEDEDEVEPPLVAWHRDLHISPLPSRDSSTGARQTGARQSLRSASQTNGDSPDSGVSATSFSHAPQPLRSAGSPSPFTSQPPPQPRSTHASSEAPAGHSRGKRGSRLSTKPDLAINASPPRVRRLQKADTSSSVLLPASRSVALHEITPPVSSHHGDPTPDCLGRRDSSVAASGNARWTLDQMEDSLRERSRDLKKFHQDLVSFTIKSVRPVDRRIKTGKDWFADVKHEPVPAEERESDGTVKIKVKHHTRGRKDHSNLHFRPIRIKSDTPRVPPYRFLHKEIARNVLKPSAMLKFIPVVRDLESGEDLKYNVWLKELERQEAECGFEPLGSREDRVRRTERKERTAVLSLYLDFWLEKLAIPGCDRAALIRFVMGSDSDEGITPNQRSILANLHSDGVDHNQSPSPHLAKTAKMFCEAFNRVFANNSLPQEQQVSLRDVLLLDKDVEHVVESKKTAKSPSSQEDSQEDPQSPSIDGFIDTHVVMGCLICFSNSCEHGDYHNSHKRNFSVDIYGKQFQMFSKTQAARDKKDHDGTLIQPCLQECYLLHGEGDGVAVAAKPWSEDDDLLLKSLFAATESSSRVRSKPQCMAAEMLDRKCWEVHRRLAMLAPKVPEDDTPNLPAAKTLSWYDRHKKMLMADWQEQTDSHNHKLRVSPDPCHHDGPCTEANGCECVLNNILCERFCRCTAENCSYKFTGCACSGSGKTCLERQKEGRPCICVQLNRECDPALCGTCGVAERTHPKNRENEALMDTGCQNCALQRGVSKAVAPGKSLLEGCGYGLFALEDIPQHDFVIEYTGEIIVSDEGVRREARRGEAFDNEHPSSYLFTLLDSEGIWVDAAIYGNLARYVNHAGDDYNLDPKIIYVNGEFRIRFTAARDIRAGEELFINYGENYPNLTKKMIKEKVGETEAEASPTLQTPKPNGRGRGDKNGSALSGSKERTSARKEAPRLPATELDDIFDHRIGQPLRRRKRKRDDDEEDETEEYLPSMEDPESRTETQESDVQGLRRRVKRKTRSPKSTMPVHEAAKTATRRRTSRPQLNPRSARGVSATQNVASLNSPQPKRRGRPPKSRPLEAQSPVIEAHQRGSNVNGKSPNGSASKVASPTGGASGRERTRGFSRGPASRNVPRSSEAMELTGDTDSDGNDGVDSVEDGPVTPTPKFQMNTRRKRRSNTPRVVSDSDESSHEAGQGEGDSLPSATPPSSRAQRERKKPARYRDDEE